MIQYRRILELHLKQTSQRTISSSVGHSRQTVSDVIQKAEKLGLIKLTDDMNNQWLEEFLFPEKLAVAKGYFPWIGRRSTRNCKRKYYTKITSQ